MTDLKPCPFCKSKEVYPDNDIQPLHMGCNNCGAEGPLGDTDGSKWNAAQRREEREES